MNRNIEHLRLLAIFHYVVAAMAALVGLLPADPPHHGTGVYLCPGHHVWPAGPQRRSSPHKIMGIFFVAFASLFILMGWTFAICVFLAGRSLARRRHYTFCLVMAAIMCIFMPFGTVLGVFTVVVLMRPSVKPLFKGSRPNVHSDPITTG